MSIPVRPSTRLRVGPWRGVGVLAVVLGSALGAACGGARPGNAADGSGTPAATTPAAPATSATRGPAASAVPAPVEAVGHYGENAYDMAKANDWTKARAAVDSLKQAIPVLNEVDNLEKVFTR